MLSCVQSLTFSKEKYKFGRRKWSSDFQRSTVKQKGFCHITLRNSEKNVGQMMIQSQTSMMFRWLEDAKKETNDAGECVGSIR